MIFYKRFMGDYQRKTGHLGLAEVGAYDRLLDHYYASERPLPGDLQACFRIAGAMTASERTAVKSVLKSFFRLAEDGMYRQPRADEEIASAQPKMLAARANGCKGGRPKRNPNGTREEPNGFSNLTQPEPTKKASQSQSQKEQRTTPPPPAGGADGFDRFWSVWPQHPRKVARKQCEGKWRKMSLEGLVDDIFDHVVALKGGEKWREADGRFIPSPLVYLTQRRWEAPTSHESDPDEWHSTRAGIESKAIELGLGLWDQDAFDHGRGEHWPAYKARVLQAAGVGQEQPSGHRVTDVLNGAVRQIRAVSR